MIRPKRNDEVINVTKQELLRVLSEDDALKKLLQTLLQEVLEAEIIRKRRQVLTFDKLVRPRGLV